MLTTVRLTERQKRHGYFANPDSSHSPRAPLLENEPAIHCYMCRDGTRDIVLTKPLVYVDPHGAEWIVKAGRRSNGQSSPRIFWPFMDPYQPRVREASVVHDEFCPKKGMWLKSAWLFYHGMCASGLRCWRAWIRWFGVVAFGWWRLLLVVA